MGYAALLKVTEETDLPVMSARSTIKVTGPVKTIPRKIQIACLLTYPSTHQKGAWATYSVASSRLCLLHSTLKYSAPLKSNSRVLGKKIH